MRRLLLFATLGFVLAPLASSHAQSAYDYPICAVRSGKSGAMSCYYSSYEQCMATMSGIGGHCIDSPFYRGRPVADPVVPRRKGRRY
jgi:hypothetical protein